MEDQDATFFRDGIAMFALFLQLLFGEAHNFLNGLHMILQRNPQIIMATTQKLSNDKILQKIGTGRKPSPENSKRTFDISDVHYEERELGKCKTHEVY